MQSDCLFNMLITLTKIYPVSRGVEFTTLPHVLQSYFFVQKQELCCYSNGKKCTVVVIYVMIETYDIIICISTMDEHLSVYID